MEHLFEIDRSRNLVRERWSGEVTLRDYSAAFAELKRHPDYCEGMDALSDYRAARIKLSYEEMRILASRSTADERWNRVAIVVARLVDYGLARMYRALTEPHPAHIKEFSIFTSVEEADDWLLSPQANDLPRSAISRTLNLV
jgi:hypothetical protein